jgi:hypothetical protein
VGVGYHYFFQNCHNGHQRNAGHGFVVAVSKAHFKNSAVELCIGRSLDFMASPGKIQASHHSFSATDTWGKYNWLDIPLSERNNFCCYPASA